MIMFMGRGNHQPLLVSVIIGLLLIASCALREGIKKGTEDQGLSDSKISEALKEVLEISTANAIERVSKMNGYYLDQKIRIPPPNAIQKVEKVLRALGHGPEVGAFELSMNRAAERAAPGAKGVFLEAIKEMTFSDTRKILNGRENEATLYFKNKCSDSLQKIFQPIVHKAMSEVDVTRAYQDLKAKAQGLPSAASLSFDLDQYVTHRALDGLFFVLAEEERKIRQDPAARVTDLLKKVFGSR